MLTDQVPLLTLDAKMDALGNKAARARIAIVKVAVPNMACCVADWAIQVFGGGTSNDLGLVMAYVTPSSSVGAG